MTDLSEPIELQEILDADLPARISRDEWNLAEYPIALLSSRAGDGQKTLEFSDTIRGENNKPVKRQWIVTGSDKFGLPLAGDEDVFLALLEVTKDEGFTERTVPISRYDIIERLGLAHTGPSYQRVKDALDRLSGVQIYAKNAFFDKSIKRYTSVSFGILEGYILIDETPGRKSEQLKFKHLSSVTWSEAIFKSFLAGNLKRLDLNRYFSLRTATARRLYRYLDKRFADGKSQYEENLFHLAYERMGMSRTRKYVSQVKEKLKQAHEELVGCGFLREVKYREGQEGEVVIYSPGSGMKTLPPRRSRRPSPPKEEKPEIPPLVQQLIEHGVGKTVAARLAKECPGEVERQLEYFPYVKPSEIRTAPGAYLTDAIKNGYGPPPAFVKAQRAKAREKKNTDAREKPGQTEEEKRIASIREKLLPEELEAIEKEAVELYFDQYPHMRRTLGKKIEDPKHRRKVAGGIMDRLLLERYGEG